MLSNYLVAVRRPGSIKINIWTGFRTGYVNFKYFFISNWNIYFTSPYCNLIRNIRYFNVLYIYIYYRNIYNALTAGYCLQLLHWLETKVWRLQVDQYWMLIIRCICIWSITSLRCIPYIGICRIYQGSYETRCIFLNGY